MPTFWADYDADTDSLDVRFGPHQQGTELEHALNDSIVLQTDPYTGAVRGLRFAAYSRLLGVSETELVGLHDLADNEIDAMLGLLCERPASLFLDVTDAEALIARVLAPSLHELVLDGR